MGLCWSSPPVVEQEVELPDLENQLSAPKPRPTAATSWTHKPAILIPATLVCLILSGFALSIFLGYNSMSETRPGSTKISIPSGNTTPIATQSGKSSASEQIDDDITIHHPTRTVTPPNKSVTTEELVSDPLQSDSEIISGGLDNSHVLEDPAKTITKPTVNIPNSNGTQPLESDSSSNILSPPKSAGTTSVETDKSSTVQNPANSATKTLGKSTSKIIVEDQAKPIESIQTGGANLPSGQVYHPTSLTLKNNQTPPDANTIPPSFDNAFPTGPRSPATELQNADTNPESEPQVDESQTSDNTPSSDHQSQETELLKADAAQMPNLMILNPQTSPGSKTDNITPTGPQPPKSGFVSNSPTPNTSDDNAQDTPMNVKPVDVDPPSDHPVTPEKSVGPEDQQSSEDISGPPGYSPAPKNSLNSATNNLTEPNGPAILEESASFENEQQFFDVIISELSSDDGTKGPPENPSTSEETISSELSGVIRSTPDNSPASEQTKDASEQTKGTPPNKSDTKLSQSDDIPIVKPPSTLSVQSLSGSMNSNSPANVLTQTTSHDPPQEIVD
eukprot:116809_1